MIARACYTALTAVSTSVIARSPWICQIWALSLASTPACIVFEIACPCQILNFNGHKIESIQNQPQNHVPHPFSYNPSYLKHIVAAADVELSAWYCLRKWYVKKGEYLCVLLRLSSVGPFLFTEIGHGIFEVIRGVFKSFSDFGSEGLTYLMGNNDTKKSQVRPIKISWPEPSKFQRKRRINLSAHLGQMWHFLFKRQPFWVVCGSFST